MAEHEEISHQYDDGNGNQKHDWGLRGRRYISHSNVSMRLFGSTGEPRCPRRGNPGRRTHNISIDPAKAKDQIELGARSKL